MKIVADENIPLVAYYFGHCGDIILKPGRAITREDLLGTDILLVRSVTPVNAALLNNTSIKFVGSPVSGLDHLDVEWLNQQQITWASASACNADAVVEYVITVLAYLQKMNLLAKQKLSIGIIGVGSIGSKLASTLTAFNHELILCDPIRAEHEVGFASMPLNELTDLDLITIHTPLTMNGSHPTYHLLTKQFLQQQKSNCFLVNTARGAVLDSLALKKYGNHINACLDVWENEPTIDPDIVKQTIIATPHIAGYSMQSKYRGIEMIYRKACALGIIPPTDLTAPPYPTHTINFSGETVGWIDVILKIFDIGNYSEQVKQILISSPQNLAAHFDQLRKEFNNRHEFGFVKIQNAHFNAQDRAILAKLGFDF